MDHSSIDKPQQHIDIVYTWVNGADPEWRSRFAQYFKKLPDSKLYNDSDAAGNRYHSFDELKYSLRSLERYCDFFRTIFIVTDRQIPGWLNTDHPQIRIIDHSEIIDKRHLPTFNSIAIEANLHRIKDLSESFIYFNDDVILNKKIIPEEFFDQHGNPVFYVGLTVLPSGATSASEPGWVSASKNASNVLNELFGISKRFHIAHVPHAARLNIIKEIQDRISFEPTSSSRVRSVQNINSFNGVYPYYAYHTQRATRRFPDHVLIEITEDIPSNAERLSEALARSPKFICLQDCRTAFTDDTTRQCFEFLESILPSRSVFEKY